MSTFAWMVLVLGVIVGLAVGVVIGWIARGARRRYVA